MNEILFTEFTINTSTRSLLLFFAGLVCGVLVMILLGRRKIVEIENNIRQKAAQEYQPQLNRLETQLAVAKERLHSQLQMHERLQQSEREAATLRTENTRLQSRLEHEAKYFDGQLKLLTEAKVHLTKEFENIAHKIFDNKQQQFTRHSRQTLELTLDPVKLQLKEFKQKVEEVYEKENAERNKLVGQIGELQKQTRRVSEDALNLANALKGDNKAQGNWGEVILERLLEESGLQKGREYETQVALRNDDGRRRNPDVIVRLPDNKDIIIDAKVSLVDYERYCAADTDGDRQQALKRHISSLRAHITNLSFKDYEKLKQVRTLDFVFIFIPIEAAFMLALQHEPSIFREAYDKHIILVSPTTLLASLRTVEGIWRYEKQNKNAEKIASQAGALYDQFVALVEVIEEVGRNLDKAQQSYSTVQKRLVSGRGNLVKRVQDIKRLGAKTKKSIHSELISEAEQGDSLGQPLSGYAVENELSD